MLTKSSLAPLDLSDHAVRQRVVRQLRIRADEYNAVGDAALTRADWNVSSAAWSVAARCIRSAQSLSAGKPTDPDDHLLIRAALAVVRSAQ